MASSFAAAMAKLAILGHNVKNLVDCSDVIPVPPKLNRQVAFPAGLTKADVEQAVSDISWGCGLLTDRSL